MSRRIGLLGGMFDPVHRGHMAMAEQAIQQLELDELRFVPCHLPNHRPAAQASGEQRLAMLKLVVAGRMNLVVDDWELRREHTSYWIETLRHFHQQDATAQWVTVLGMDSFNSLPQWQGWPQLSQLCHWYVLARAGEQTDSSVSGSIAAGFLLAQDSKSLFAGGRPGLLFATDFSFPYSSTEVRGQLSLAQQSASCPPALEQAVFDFILRYGLYGAHA